MLAGVRLRLLSDWEEPDGSDHDPLLPEGRDDPAVEAAKKRIREWFREHPGRIVYQQQLCVLLEDEFFHWITRRSAEELVAEGRLAVESVELGRGGKPLRVYRLPSHRTWRRQGKRLVELVRSFSPGTPLGDSLGLHGELMFDAAMGTIGFTTAAKEVREWGGVTWVESNHDLDRVYVRDNVAYGVEIKNTLKYIPQDEFNLKLRMCKALGLKPLFITRFSAKTYNYTVYRAGGFALLFKTQLYPFGFSELAAAVTAELGLPVKCPVAVEEGRVKTFLNWHQKSVAP